VKKIIVFGSINTDLVINTPYIPDEGETIKGYEFYMSHGGKGANQAVAAAKLGGDVHLIGCLGNDDFGKNSLIALKKQNVRTTYVSIIDNIASAVAMILRTNGDNRIILNSGSNEYLSATSFKNFIDSHGYENSIFVTQLENKPEEVFKALKMAKEHGMVTLFNPTPAMKLEDDIFKSIDILVINQTESKIITSCYPNTFDDCPSIYLKLRNLGLKTLIITLGKKGSAILSENGSFFIEGIKMNTIDSTGAGDAYIGALAYGLSCDYSLQAAAELANKVSALTVTSTGAQESMPTLEQVNNYFNKN